MHSTMNCKLHVHVQIQVYKYSYEYLYLVKETDDLQKKQLWYKQKQSSITKDEEVEYVSYCGEAMYRIHILEQRLNRYPA